LASSPESDEDARPALRSGGSVFNRVVLKLSGEALMGDEPYGIDPARIAGIARQVKGAAERGVDVAIVVGAGNIFRGLQGMAIGMDRATADYMGMIATMLNALAIQDALEKVGLATRVQSAIAMQEVAEPYIRRRAIRHLEKGRVVIFAAGTGNPFFTTDTAAALRATEMNCDAILKATQVDGVYDADPKRDPGAKRFERLSYLDVLSKDLRVMDASAISLARESAIPILVFFVHAPGALVRVLRGEGTFTIITGEAAAS